ncbi:MAG: hypothetical protein NUV55_03015 [Sulfuricaulis sp.]|uniref:hypothetical protein n=1 Tax=Sulfuricaulis sp. TaxID=2003553 RepID=UPI0025E6592D|nr:hypothetical protein [Sulfuricaulis sp.]MCR4346166.1 hypothetical protein [Sulfuricaulis sp.]
MGMNSRERIKKIIAKASLSALVVAGVFGAPTAHAFRNYSEYAAACRAEGGTPSPSPARCDIPSNRGNADSGYDYGAAQRAREAEAAAAAERQRQAEAERIERERLAEEKRQKDAAFIRDRDAAANTLKGSTGTNTSQLKGISGTDNYGLKGSGTDPGAQLKSVERHSRDAQEQASKGKETARETARMGFDIPGKASGNLVYPDKKQRQIPPSALDKRVPPEAQKDPQVQQSLAWYRKLDAQKAEKEKMIAEIKEQKKTSKDPVLDAKIATLNNDVKIITGDQAKATETVEKRVKNLGFNLVEAPEPTTTNANKK